MVPTYVLFNCCPYFLSIFPLCVLSLHVNFEFPELLNSQHIQPCLCSSCRRSVIEAVYNRLNPYKEEDGVSVYK